jgi:LmbE family N-acetylglucosaminyl deacetylase
MLPLLLDRRAGAKLTILCLGAHADDIEIGAGGTILTLLHHHHDAQVMWVVFSASGERAQEAKASAAAFLGAASPHEVSVHGFRDGFFPSEFERLKETFEAIKAHFHPTLIFTHHHADRHQDHRTLAELTWNTFRDHLVVEYEIPKYDPDLGNPNLFVPLTPAVAARKVELLVAHFTSQQGRRWFVPATFHAMMQIRGVQAASPSGLAEGFHASKLQLQI